MPQLSLFAADAEPAVPADVAGLLAAHGQSWLGDKGDHSAAVSVLVDARWRADALAQWLGGAGLTVEVSEPDPTRTPRGDEPNARFGVAIAASPLLVPLVRAWRKGAVKTVPENWTPTPGQLRTWVVAAGRPVPPAGYGLGIDDALEHHAPQRDALLGALSRAGLAATFVRPRGSAGALLRITSTRRLRRLAETVGDVPKGVDPDVWPRDRSFQEP